GAEPVGARSLFIVQLEAPRTAERGDRVAVAAGLDLLLGEAQQRSRVAGGQGFEPSDRLADGELLEVVTRRVAREEAERRPAGFPEERGGITAHAEVHHGVVPAVDDRQRHVALRLAE